MVHTKPLAFGKRQGRVARVNSIKSPKLQTYSTIIQFFTEIDTPYGKSLATEGYFGVALTTELPKDLNPGDLVNVDIVSYQSGINPQNGQEALQARCLLMGKAIENVRTQVAVPETANTNR